MAEQSQEQLEKEAEKRAANDKDIIEQIIENWSEAKIFKLRSQRLEEKIRGRKSFRNVTFGIGLVIMLVFLGLLISIAIRPAEINPETHLASDFRDALAFLIFPFALIFLILAAVGHTTLSGPLEELAGIKTKQKTERLKDDSEMQSEYFGSLVKLNIESLSEYYNLVKLHTSNSFRATLAAGLVGFFFIIFGLMIGLLGRDNAQMVAVISTASGIIINFVAAIFFYLYNQTVRQLKSYHDNLLDVQNVLLSFKILEGLPKNEAKSQMILQLLSFLVGKRYASNLEVIAPNIKLSPNANGGVSASSPESVDNQETASG
jgi:hypothetical protein